MKIAIVAQPFDAVLPPAQNSIGIIAYHSALQLAERARVTVFLPGPREAEEPPVQPEIDWRWVDTAPQARIERGLQRLGVTQPVDSRWFHLPYIWRVASELRRDPHDIVHLFNFPQFAAWLGRRIGQRTAISLEMQCDWLSQWRPERVRPGLRRCALVWGVSRHVSELISAAHPDLQARLGTVGNGFDTGRFRPQPPPASDRGEIRMLFVGRVSPEKGVHLAIEALGMLAEDFPDLRLRLVGPRTQLPRELIVDASDDPLVRGLARFYDGREGPDYQACLDRRIAELGLAERVCFRGNVPQAELADEYAQADLLLNPSYSESFGMSLVEAMAVGRPVVATRVGGMQDIVVDGDTGVLVPPDDAAALAAALRRLLGDPALRARMAAAGQQRALAEFSWQARAERLWQGFTGVHAHG